MAPEQPIHNILPLLRVGRLGNYLKIHDYLAYCQTHWMAPHQSGERRWVP